MSELKSITPEELKALGNQAFGLAFRILGHRDDAADAVQDAMHQLYRKRASFDSERGTLRSWFLTIVRNRCVDMQRKSKASTANEYFDPVDAKQKTAEQETEQSELVLNVQAALQELSPDSREIILLRDFHGLTYAEIADVLKVASGTVMSRLHRARTQLREQYLKLTNT